HVHLGVNAVERLMTGLDKIRELRRLPCQIPDAVRRVILAAKPVSEAVSGIGEAETLQSVTVNIGRIEGGIAVNVIPDAAKALVDIRIPPGLVVADIERAVAGLLHGLPGITHRRLS